MESALFFYPQKNTETSRGIRGMRPIKVSFIPVKGSHRFHIKNTNRHYADPLNPQIKLDKRLNGDDDDGVSRGAQAPAA